MMIGKIVDNKIVQPPVNDGNKLNVYLNADWLEANGFVELTPEEIKQARTSFNIREIQDACDAIDTTNSNTVLNDKLDALTPRQLRHLTGAGGTVDLTDQVTQEAMSTFTEDEITAIKVEIP